MAAIVNARDVLLQAAATRFVTPALVGTVDFANVTGGTKPSNNADVTQTAVNSGVTATAGGITLSGGGAIKGGQTDYAIGTGVFLGYSGGAYKLSVGTPTKFIKFDGADVTFSGALSAASGTFTGSMTAGSIAIDGTATINGNTYSADVGDYSALVVNEAGVRKWGVSGLGGVNGAGLYGIGYYGHGVQGSASAAGKYGVYGIAKAGGSAAAGVYGWSGTSVPGVEAVSNIGGVALKITGQTQWGSYSWSSPAGSTSNFLREDGTWSDPVTTAKVNAAFGASENDVCQVIVTDSGTATASGAGFNFVSLIPGYRTRASGNNIYIEPFP